MRPSMRLCTRARWAFIYGHRVSFLCRRWSWSGPRGEQNLNRGARRQGSASRAAQHTALQFWAVALSPSPELEGPRPAEGVVTVAAGVAFQGRAAPPGKGHLQSPGRPHIRSRELRAAPPVVTSPLQKGVNCGQFPTIPDPTQG